jgi:hypothetical protein
MKLVYAILPIYCVAIELKKTHCILRSRLLLMPGVQQRTLATCLVQRT